MVKPALNQKPLRGDILIFFILFWAFAIVNLSTLVPDGRLRQSWLLAPLIGWMVAVIPVIRAKLSLIHWLVMGLAAVLLGHLLSLSLQQGLYLGMAGFIAWGAWLGMFFYLSGAKNRQFWIVGFMAIFLIAGLSHSSTIFFESITGIIVQKQTTIGDVSRRYGIVQSISVLGVQIGVGSIAAVYFWSSVRSRFLKLMFVVAWVTQFIALFLVGSRGPLVFTALALIWVLMFLRGSKISLTLVLATFGIIFVMLVLPILEARGIMNAEFFRFVSVAISSDDLGNMVRFQRWQHGLDVLLSSPENTIFGIGSGVTTALPNLLNLPSETHESSLVKMFVELGVIGGAFFIGIVGMTLARSISSLRSEAATSGHSHTNLAGLVCCFAAFLVVLLEVCIHDMMMAWVIPVYFWTLLACLSMDSMEQNAFGSHSYEKRPI